MLAFDLVVTFVTWLAMVSWVFVEIVNWVNRG